MIKGKAGRAIDLEAFKKRARQEIAPQPLSSEDIKRALIKSSHDSYRFTMERWSYLKHAIKIHTHYQYTPFQNEEIISFVMKDLILQGLLLTSTRPKPLAPIEVAKDIIRFLFASNKPVITLYVVFKDLESFNALETMQPVPGNLLYRAKYKPEVLERPVMRGEATATQRRTLMGHKYDNTAQYYVSGFIGIDSQSIIHGGEQCFELYKESSSLMANRNLLAPKPTGWILMEPPCEKAPQLPQEKGKKGTDVISAMASLPHRSTSSGGKHVRGHTKKTVKNTLKGKAHTLAVAKRLVKEAKDHAGHEGKVSWRNVTLAMEEEAIAEMDAKLSNEGINHVDKNTIRDRLKKAMKDVQQSSKKGLADTATPPSSTLNDLERPYDPIRDID
ncbi:Nn.00g073970.m01.CDS01 [Neocucurbitaria sp. VM-36]